MITTLGDLGKFSEAEAVVSAHNGTFMDGSIATRAIMQCGGMELAMECMRMKEGEPAEVKITKGYRLPCKNVIHAYVPYWFANNENAEG